MSSAFFDEDILGKFEDEEIFLKGTVKSDVEGARKVALNRRGNELFNSGDIEKARRIFITTGYSDGLSRVGDYYREKGLLVDALRMYWIAHDRKKSTALCMEFSIFIKGLLNEDKADDSD